MTKTATDWIAWLEAEPRSEPDLSIATVLREQAAEIERLGRDLAAARLLLDERPLTDEPGACPHRRKAGEMTPEGAILREVCLDCGQPVNRNSDV